MTFTTSLGDLTYDVQSLLDVGTHTQLTGDIGGNDSVVNTYSFTVTQKNGLTIDVIEADSKESLSFKLVKDGSDYRTVDLNQGTNNYFLNVDPGEYTVDVTSQNAELINYLLNIRLGTPDTEVSGYVRAGDWYDNNTITDKGTLNETTSISVDGHALMSGPDHQWLSDGYSFDLEESGTVTFDVNQIKNESWFNFQVNGGSTAEIVDNTGSSTSGEYSFELLKGTHTFRYSAKGVSGAFNKYGIDVTYQPIVEPEVAVNLGDLTYDVNSLTNSLGSFIPLSGSVDVNDNDNYTFTVSQNNGIVIDTSTTNDVSLKLIKDGSDYKTISIPQVTNGDYFVNVESGNYSLEVNTSQSENVDYQVNLQFGTPDTEASGYVKSGDWYDSSLITNVGTLNETSSISVNGYALMGGNDQWNSDAYSFSLQKDTVVTFDVDQLKNVGWYNFQVNNGSTAEIIDNTGTTTNGVFSFDLDQGDHTFRVSSKGGNGLFNQYQINVNSSTDSDERLKENIVNVGTSPSGINIYEWNYKGNNDLHRGVIAQEVLQSNPDAVYIDDNGYMGVYYGKIDVDYENLSEVSEPVAVVPEPTPAVVVPVAVVPEPPVIIVDTVTPEVPESPVIITEPVLVESPVMIVDTVVPEVIEETFVITPVKVVEKVVEDVVEVFSTPEIIVDEIIAPQVIKTVDDPIIDNIAPNVESAYIKGKKVIVEFDELVDAGKLSKKRFKLNIDDDITKFKKSFITNNNDNIAILKLNQKIVIDEIDTISLQYKDPKKDQHKNVVEDLFGNDMETFKNFEVDVLV